MHRCLTAHLCLGRPPIPLNRLAPASLPPPPPPPSSLRCRRLQALLSARVLRDRCRKREVGSDLLIHLEEVRGAVLHARECDPNPDAVSGDAGPATSPPRPDWGAEGCLDCSLEVRLRAAISLAEIRKLSKLDGGVSDPSGMFRLDGEKLFFCSSDKNQRFRVTNAGALERAFAAGFPEGWPEGSPEPDAALREATGATLPQKGFSSFPAASVRSWGFRELHFSHTDARYRARRDERLQRLPKPFQYGLHDAEDAAILFLACVEEYTSLGPNGYVTKRFEAFLADFGRRGAPETLAFPAADNLESFFAGKVPDSATEALLTSNANAFPSLEKEGGEAQEADAAVEVADSDAEEVEVPLSELPQTVTENDALEYVAAHPGYRLPSIVPMKFRSAQEKLLKRARAELAGGSAREARARQ